ncbi:MAG TPA: ADP-glyceromanno-heptose 6-epimerase [Candidatus Kapabacteria bacterium]|nr:ADP-glyceromanno-heptose 6-epimerase [Candidatus Kapabacteria bacterium]
MIVLTGGAGFIGSCFLRRLNDEGIKDILVVDHLGNSDKWKNLVRKNFTDYLNKEEFLLKLNSNHYKGQIEAIIHLGACSSTTEIDVEYLMSNNVAYSKSIAQYSIQNDIRFIYASSAATYGDGSNGYSDLYNDMLEPLNGYGFSKQLFDLWILRNELEDKIVGLKFFNVFGPNEYHKGSMSSMVLKSYNQFINNGSVKLFKSNSPLYKDGEQRRDFIYVKDCCEVLWQLLNNKKVNGIFNLGTGKSRNWNELVSAVKNKLAVLDDKYTDCTIEYIDMPINLRDQYQNYTEADMTKLNKTDIQFSPLELEDSISDYVENYLYKNYSIY